MCLLSVTDAPAVNVVCYGNASEEKIIVERTFSRSEINYSYAYTPEQLIDFVGSGKADIGIGNISISEARYEKVDFTFPYKDIETIAVFENDHHLAGYLFVNKISVLWLCLLIFVFANLIWIFEKGNGKIENTYFPGLFSAIYFLFITLTSVGYEDYTSRRISKAIVVMLMLFGMGVYASLVSGLVFIGSQNYKFNDIKDIKDHKIGTFSESYASAWLRENNFTVIEVGKSEKIDFNGYEIFVYDEPYINSLKSSSMTKISFSLFKQYYGIAVNKNRNDLRVLINKTILM